jgi:hypothetical protein
MDIIKDGPQTGKWPPIHSYANCSVAQGNIMDILKDGPQTGKWPPIHSYANCSVAQGNIQERFASALWGQDT